jgi:hypothetical protein
VSNGVEVTAGIKVSVGESVGGISEAVAVGTESTIGVVKEAFCPQAIKRRNIKQYTLTLTLSHWRGNLI